MAMAVRRPPFTIIPVIGHIMRARAIAAIRSIEGGPSSAAPGITVRFTIATMVAIAIFGMAGAGIAALCAQARDFAEALIAATTEASTAGTVASIAGIVGLGAAGDNSKR